MQEDVATPHPSSQRTVLGLAALTVALMIERARRPGSGRRRSG